MHRMSSSTGESAQRYLKAGITEVAKTARQESRKREASGLALVASMLQPALLDKSAKPLPSPPQGSCPAEGAMGTDALGKLAAEAANRGRAPTPAEARAAEGRRRLSLARHIELRCRYVPPIELQLLLRRFHVRQRCRGLVVAHEGLGAPSSSSTCSM